MATPHRAPWFDEDSFTGAQYDLYASYNNASSFQIISAGTDGEYGSRLFVGNLTMHAEASNEPGAPAIRPGAWIADVTYDLV